MSDVQELIEEKKFYERFWNLHRDPQLVEVFKCYGPEGFRRSSVLEGFEQFIRTADFRGRVCVEIGTLKGLTALILSRYFKKVVTIDVKRDPVKHEIAGLLGIRNVEYHDVIDNRAKADLIAALAFDAAYVDGDHTNDTESDFALVKGCGQVMYHEHWSAQPSVVSLFDRLAAERDCTVTTGGKFALWRRR